MRVEVSGKVTANRDLRRCSHIHKESSCRCNNGVKNYKCPLSKAYQNRDINVAANIAIEALLLYQKDNKIVATPLTRPNLIDINGINKFIIKHFYVKKRNHGGCILSDL